MRLYDPEDAAPTVRLVPARAKTLRGRCRALWRCDVFIGAVPLIKLHFILMIAILVLVAVR